MWSVVWARKGEVKITLIDLGGRDSVQVCKDCVVSSVHYPTPAPAPSPATDSIIITNIIPFQNHPHQSLSIFLLSISLFLSIFPPLSLPINTHDADPPDSPTPARVPASSDSPPGRRRSRAPGTASSARSRAASRPRWACPTARCLAGEVRGR
jgi:hypothetical protein